jgi:hypothetical protein
MHPILVTKARAAHVMSAPRAIVRISENPLQTRPEALILTFAHKSAPINMFLTTTNPSSNGNPIELVYSGGAAPVPPSPPSTVMKSGPFPISTIALTRAAISPGSPTQSLRPSGIPLLSSLSLAMNSTNSQGLLNAECLGGLWQSDSFGRIGKFSCFRNLSSNFGQRQYSAELRFCSLW